MSRKVNIKLEPVDNTPNHQLYPLATWEEAFFEGFAQYGIISDACKVAGVPRGLIAWHRKNTPEFEERFVETLDGVRDKVRRALMERSIDGVVHPVYQLGKLVGYDIEHDNKLLMFVAERLLREEYHLTEKHEITGGTPIRFEFVLGEKPDVEGEIEDAEILAIEEAESSELDEASP